MATLNVEIGGRQYDVACRDGEEPHLRMLAQIVDGKVREATAAVGGLQDVRQLLFAALLLADELNEIRSRPVAVPEPPAPPPPQPLSDPDIAAAMERLAERMEEVAGRLEGGRASA
jgi:cell division protein ZapA